MSSKGKYKNGKKDGRWVDFDEFNEIISVSYYKNGNGCRIISEIEFSSDEDFNHHEFSDDEIEIIDNLDIDGEVIEYLVGGFGDISSILNYKNGKLHGECISYYEYRIKFGMLFCKGFFKNGLRHGQFIWVNKNGTVRKEEIYFNGKLIDTINDNISGSKRKVFTFDGQYELVNYKNDKKQGKFTRYNENDLICGYGYYEEGTIKKEYIYSDFSKKGTYEIKYENGKEIDRTFYEDID